MTSPDIKSTRALGRRTSERSGRRSQGAALIASAVAIPRVLSEFGCDADRVLVDAGVPPGCFDEPESSVSVETLARVLSHCTAVTGCDHFGLKAGQEGDLRSLGRIGFVALNSPDVGSALTSIITYLGQNDAAAVTLSIRGKLGSLGYVIRSPVEGGNQVIDAAMAVICRIMRTLCGPEWHAGGASFAHGKPGDLVPYRRYFRTKLHFEARESALHFGTDLLSRKLDEAEPDLRRMLLWEIERCPAGNARPNRPEHIRRAARVMLMNGACSPGALARLFNISEGKLRAELRAYQTSLKRIFEEVRFERAQALLAGGDLAILDVGRLLHFPDKRGFVRAFSRWAGMPPEVWREMQRAGKASSR